MKPQHYLYCATRRCVYWIEFSSRDSRLIERIFEIDPGAAESVPAGDLMAQRTRLMYAPIQRDDSVQWDAAIEVDPLSLPGGIYAYLELGKSLAGADALLRMPARMGPN